MGSVILGVGARGVGPAICDWQNKYHPVRLPLALRLLDLPWPTGGNRGPCSQRAKSRW